MPFLTHQASRGAVRFRAADGPSFPSKENTGNVSRAHKMNGPALVLLSHSIHLSGQPRCTIKWDSSVPVSPLHGGPLSSHLLLVSAFKIPCQGPHEPHPLLEVTGLTCHPCPSLTLFSRSGNGHLLPVLVWENLDPGHFLLTGLTSEPELDIAPCSCSCFHWTESVFLGSAGFLEKPCMPGNRTSAPEQKVVEHGVCVLVNILGSLSTPLVCQRKVGTEPALWAWGGGTQPA